MMKVLAVKISPVIFAVIALEFSHLIKRTSIHGIAIILLARGPSVETSEHCVGRITCDSYTKMKVKFLPHLRDNLFTLFVL